MSNLELKRQFPIAATSNAAGRTKKSSMRMGHPSSNDQLERSSVALPKATRGHNLSERPRRLSAYVSRPLQTLVRCPTLLVFHNDVCKLELTRGANEFDLVDIKAVQFQFARLTGSRYFEFSRIIERNREWNEFATPRH